jgi:glycosyltransferase involved in cell wall biosynthesis
MQQALIRIVIPCRNADGTIESCLSAISRSEGIDFEVVIVDDDENATLNELKEKYRCGVVRSKGGVGAGAARNLGAAGFAGDILVFVDADVEVLNPNTIAILAEPVKSGAAHASVGRYSGSSRGNLFATYKHRYLAYTYGCKVGELTNTFWTALCAVNRRWFEILGGFKECYTGAGPEDIEFGIELTKQGGTLVAVPEARAHHLAPLNFLGLLANDLRKGTEDIYVHWIRKVPLTNNRHVALPDILAVAFACMLSLLLVLQGLVGSLPVIVCGAFYISFRLKLLRKAFTGQGPGFLLQSVCLTFLLDIVRGIAVIAGTILWGMTALRGDQTVPFFKK